MLPKLAIAEFAPFTITKPMNVARPMETNTGIDSTIKRKNRAMAISPAAYTPASRYSNSIVSAGS
jgi:hypothetical protein